MKYVMGQRYDKISFEVTLCGLLSIVNYYTWRMNPGIEIVTSNRVKPKIASY